MDTFERGLLPPVCAVSGAASEGWYSDRFDSQVGAQYLLLLFGIVPFVLLRAITRKTAKGKIPVTREVFEAMTVAARRRSRVFLVGVLGGVVLLALGVLVALGDRASSPVGPALVVLGIVALVVGGVAGARRSTVGGHVEPSGRWVVLENVHPAFAAAVEEQVRRG